MFEPTVRADVCRCRSVGARWLVTGWNGGFHDADAAYNVTVPDGFDRTDLAAFAEERRAAADFDDDGPALLTGVSMDHARCASDGPVTVLATAGVSNPAALPVETDVHADNGNPGGVDGGDSNDVGDADGDDDVDGEFTDETAWRPGTVNLVVGVDRALADGTLAELLATCVEAKAATLLELAGVPGTTSDAVAVGCVPDGEPEAFAGSATAVGGAARACVRDAIRASFRSRYSDRDPPAGVPDAEYGVVTDRRSSVWQPGRSLRK